MCQESKQTVIQNIAKVNVSLYCQRAQKAKTC